ncbi:lipopolysaccharide export system permease protein [Zhouia amylolytica]|uniref:Lipopolysaccharide export system permease protein n=2 Tax=Zhouia amylolytica TaxID=376730 RepID=A0A1I6RU69_9FLAO|nr:LptF/LptG family permease [Zhouia amylolytica]ETN95155.1 putative permease [Zhouia amylolytica AD3]MCQ0111874.1 LptF/LptG family permease [Zhouia amylolytica]SFS68244.1 lipopolysaccharide export system permease protein [Zhouia amylolytica]
MKIIDWYILKRYLATFFVMLLLFVPIGIMVDVSEKVDKMIAREVPFDEIVNYYIDFTFYFASLLFPIFLFLSIIWFTSKLANNTEIVAILSSGISFRRFLYPYLMGASIIAVITFVMGMFIVPNASKGYNDFRYEYLKKNKNIRKTTNLYNQVNDNDFIYLSHFEPTNKIGRDFTLEHFENNELKYKISAASIRWIDKDSVYRLRNYMKRTIGGGNDIIETERRVDTVFPFNLDDLTPVSYIAETKNLFELNKFIEKERRKGSPNINRYLVVKYKRWSLPVSAFILTIIAVAVSSMKRRGGMGVNLALGISLAFIYIFFDKIFGTMAEQSGFPPLLAVSIPNIMFGILAAYLLKNAKR